MQSIILASILLLIFTVHEGSSIKCYICNSHKDSGCDLDKPPESYLRECTAEPSRKSKTGFNYCRKITQIIEFSVNNLPPDNRVIRSCAYENQTRLNYCYQRAGFGGRQIVCSCETDECNSANKLSTFSSLVNISCVVLGVTVLSIFIKEI